jgi:Na+/melibiose symporter and related transporters
MGLIANGNTGVKEEHGYFWAAAIFAVIGVLMFAVCYFGTRENVKVHRNTGKGAEKEGFKDYIKVIFKNGPLVP